jgi:hypothetical protein
MCMRFSVTRHSSLLGKQPGGFSLKVTELPVLTPMLGLDELSPMAVVSYALTALSYWENRDLVMDCRDN